MKPGMSCQHLNHNSLNSAQLYNVTGRTLGCKWTLSFQFKKETVIRIAYPTLQAIL